MVPPPASGKQTGDAAYNVCKGKGSCGFQWTWAICDKCHRCSRPFDGAGPAPGSPPSPAGVWAEGPAGVKGKGKGKGGKADADEEGHSTKRRRGDRVRANKDSWYGNNQWWSGGGWGEASGVTAAAAAQDLLPCDIFVVDDLSDTDDVPALEAELKLLASRRWRKHEEEAAIQSRLDTLKQRQADERPAWQRLQRAAWDLKKAEKAVDHAQGNVEALETARGCALQALTEADRQLADGRTKLENARHELESVRVAAAKTPGESVYGLGPLRAMLDDFKASISGAIDRDPKKRQAMASMEAAFSQLVDDGPATPGWVVQTAGAAYGHTSALQASSQPPRAHSAPAWSEPAAAAAVDGSSWYVLPEVPGQRKLNFVKARSTVRDSSTPYGPSMQAPPLVANDVLPAAGHASASVAGAADASGALPGVTEGPGGAVARSSADGALAGCP